MSRGLGRRQVAFLRALGRLEALHRDYARRIGWFPLWKVLSEMMDETLQSDLAAYRARIDDEYQRWVEERAKRRLSLEHRAAAGDAEAKEDLDRAHLADALGSAMRSWRRPAYGGPPTKRPNSDMDDFLNPSRTVASLQNRGLIQRIRGDGELRLTEKGREWLAARDEKSPLGSQKRGTLP